MFPWCVNRQLSANVFTISTSQGKVWCSDPKVAIIINANFKMTNTYSLPCLRGDIPCHLQTISCFPRNLRTASVQPAASQGILASACPDVRDVMLALVVMQRHKMTHPLPLKLLIQYSQSRCSTASRSHF